MKANFSSKIVGLAVGALMLVALFAPAGAQNWKANSKAPLFSGKASDGKTYVLKDLLKSKKPTVVYCIGNTCPVNSQAVKYYNNIAAAYKGKVNFIGVIDTDEAGYKVWQKRFNAPFPVIFDPELKIISSYKAERSPWTFMIDAKGVIVQEWPGYSIGELNQMGYAIAKANKIKAVKLDTKGAPDQPRYG